MYKNKIDIIMFGASGTGKLFISWINSNKSKYNILAIADNDVRKLNTLFHGYPVISPKKIPKFKYDKIIITSVFFMEIMEQLRNELNINIDKITLPPKSIVSINKSYRPFENQNTLELARETLLFITDIFKKNNIPYFIDHGTLLGIIRDKDIIPWDDDIDISIERRYIDKVINIIRDNMSKMPKAGILNWKAEISYSKDSNKPVKIVLVYDCKHGNDYKKFPTSIESFIFREGKALQQYFDSPEIYFRDTEEVIYMGRGLSVPYRYKEYLTLRYKNWNIPKKDMTVLDYNDYHRSLGATYKKDIYDYDGW